MNAASSPAIEVAAAGERVGRPVVRQLAAADEARWDAFVEGCPDATFFHRAGWRRVLEDVFAHRAHYLYAEVDGRISGVLPLGHVRSVLFGNALISTPFCVYGGVAADDEASASALIDAARDLADDLKVDHLELRHLARRRPEWPCKDSLYVTFRKAIEPDHEQNMLAIPRKQRAMVRKGIKHGLQGTIDGDTERFFAIYADSVHRLGTPVFPRRYFQALTEVFGADCDVLTVSHESRPVASVLSFWFRDEVLPYYGGGTLEARAVAGYDFLYWDLMCRAAERDCRIFDYGRSKVGTGSWSFKRNWGFEAEPLHYEYHLVRSSRMPDINPLNPKYRMFVSAWKRLPLGVANLIGPHLSRSLG
ncbi:MAG: FemAB family PEP-CTERM system-associated protein [Gammaproteobacteria bacterium]|jgi:FemAB-related protein (PEP-CTERM system-associated)|nr:FemAB family PEP-CTERM system-associated protein [Gammaproteobacteria bacterium]